MSFKEKVIKHISRIQEEKLKITMQQAKLTVRKDHQNHIHTRIMPNAHADGMEYEIVEREILPGKIICPDCGGETLEGLDFCDKCGGELNGSVDDFS